MKAIVQDRYGPPEHLRYTDVADPVADGDKVLVKVAAACLNKADLIFMRGRPTLIRLAVGLKRPRTLILGRAVAGTVAAVGPDVTAFAVGDEVFGEVDQKGFAEYVATPQKHLVAIPPGVGFARAATLPVGASTALQALRAAGVADGHSVLVNGATGSVGTFTVQLAKVLGAGEVTGVCSTRNTELVASLGADRVIDYAHEDFTLGKERYDAVIDIAGNHSVSAIRRVLTERGTYVSVGGNPDSFAGPFPRVLGMLATSPFVKQRLRPLAAGRDNADLAHLAGLIAEGRLEPFIEKTAALADTAAEIGRTETEHARGKVVLTP
ncbi:NAD(P)-dependent alcohol dehydrogenase [Phytomonospora sp. NPDC050363]|uniref:NAD(P)-dependent alcohol dehydrogenase n=1 Tax=Phytomonospora sp. NPDC050363 TaxID=3155642 RepID=UPI00340F006C